MKNKLNLIFALSGTYRPRGGMSSSTLLKATNLARSGYNVRLYTFDYRPDQSDYVDQMIFDGLVGSGVKIINFYEDLMLQSKSDSPRKESAPKYIEQKENDRLTRYFSFDGQLSHTYLKGKDPTSKDSWTRYYNEKREMIRLDEASRRGTMHRITLFDAPQGKATQETLTNPAGRAYITKWINGQDQISDVFVFNAHNETSKRFDSVEGAQKDWIYHQLSSIDNTKILFIDDASSFDLMKDSLEKNKYNILTVHNNQYDPPYSRGSEINNEHRRILEHSNIWTKIVCSTDRQAVDIGHDIGDPSATVCIPQAIDAADSLAIFERNTTQNTRFATFGRLSAQKNYLQLVESFLEVIKSRPDAELHIYGEGSEREALQEQIDKSGIKKNVRLMGHTANPRARMAEYDATILCSRYEGFGLVIGESMLVGTPVIAFDCNYGPKEIIENGVDGFLVENNDFRGLERVLVEVAQDPQILVHMRLYAKNKIFSKFNRTNITGQWIELIENSLGTTL